MPQEPVIVYLKENGEPCAMHSVDAAEALRLGDYVATPPEGEKPDLAVAVARMRSTSPTPHPELMSEEERQETRRRANEEAEIQAASGRPVVVSAEQVGVTSASTATQPRGTRGQFASTARQEQQQREEQQRQEQQQREEQQRQAAQAQAQRRP
jgi:hypothetical protein